MLMLAQGCESSGLLLTRVGCLSFAPSRTLLPHTTNQIIKASDTRNLRPCTLSTNLYIVNPEPKTLKHKVYARKIVVCLCDVW